MISLATPVTADPLFPSDNDRLDYEIRTDMLLIDADGPPHEEYDMAIDMTHTIQNSSGDLYWANITTTYISPVEIFGSLIGNTTWGAYLHHYVTGEVPHMHLVTSMNWSDYSPYWFTDLFFISPGLVPGDSVLFGYSDNSFPYENNTYTYFGIPVMAGPTFTVGLNQLSTVKLAFSYEYHINRTQYPSDYVWDEIIDFEIIWEWSLGFLCQVNFDYYVNYNPDYHGGMTEAFQSGNVTLVDYLLAASPVAYFDAAAAAAGALPIWIAVIAVVVIVCLIIFFLIWRSRKGK